MQTLSRILAIEHLGTFHFLQLHCIHGDNKINVPGYFTGTLTFDKNYYHFCGHILARAENKLTGEWWYGSDGKPFHWPELVDTEGPREQVNLAELLAITAGCTMPKSVIDRVKRTCPHYIIPEGLVILDDNT